MGFDFSAPFSSERRRFRGSALLGYGVAAGATAAALFVRFALDSALRHRSPFLPFVFAVIIAARVGGRGPGYLAAGLSVLGADWFFVEPYRSLVPGDPYATAFLFVGLSTAVLIAWLVGGLRSALISAARVEKALLHQARLVDLSHDAIVTMDSERRIVGWNLGAQETYGYTDSEAIGVTINEFLQTSSAGKTIAEMDAVLFREGRWEGELNHVGRDGRRLSIESRRVLLRDETGRPTGILEINRDVTERKRAEEAVAQANIRMQAILDAAPAGILMADASGTILLASRACEAILGRRVSKSHEEAPGGFIHLEGLEPETSALPLYAALAGRNVSDSEIELRRADGRHAIILAAAKPLRTDAGQLWGAVAVFQDITERKKAEEGLKESERKYRAVFEAAAVGIGRVKFDDARWIDVNDTFCRMLGFTRQELLATPWPETTYPEDIDSDLEPFRRMAAGEIENYAVEKRFLKKDGSPLWARLSLSLVRDAAGRPDYEVAIIEDIDDRKRAEEVLRESEAHQAFLVKFNDVLRPLADPAEIQFEAARVLGEHLGANRAGYAECEHDGDTVVVARHYVDGVAGVEGRHSLGLYGAMLASDLVAGRPYVCRDIANDARFTQSEKDAYAVLAIGGMADVALVKEGRLQAVLFVHYSDSHAFSDHEILLMQDAADRTWAAVERARAEGALRESEGRYRALFESMQEGFVVGEVVCDSTDEPVDCRFLHVNEALAAMWRLPATEIVGHTGRELFPEADWEFWIKTIGRVALTGETADLEHYGSGTARFYQATVYCQAPRQFAALFTDVSERKRAEEALKESEARYRTLFESMQESFVLGEMILNAEGQPIDWHYLEVNPAFERTFERRREEIVRRTYREVFPDTARQYWVNELGRVAITGNPARLEFGDGEGERHFEAIAYSPGPGRFAAVFADVTERWRVAEALRKANETNELQLAQLEAIIRGMTDGLILGDLEGNFVELNPAALKLHGFSSNEEARRLIREQPDLFEVYDLQGRPLDRNERPLARAVRGETFANQEIRVRRRDTGKEFIGNYSGTLVQDGSGRALLPILMARDVTEQKRAAEALQRTQKAESIGLLAGGVAHDFNNLLTVIIGSASAALEEQPSSEYLQPIISAAERAAGLTKQLLAYAGKGQVVKQAVDLSALALKSRDLLAASVPKRFNLTFELREDLPPVEDDPSRVEQILMNLVINAAEAIPPKTNGHIQIATGAAEVTPEMARQQPRYDIRPGAYSWLEVRDNGTGMDPATIERIFDPFFSTKFTGRGLGLAAVDGIVRSSSGFIEVHSHPGGGSTFRVFLPASEKKKAAEPVAGLEPSSTRNASTILVVDDEEMVRTLARSVLSRHGYQVLEATDGKHALQVLAEARSTPSAVILDLAMPVMGGDELAPILAERYPGLKLIISSGYPEEKARSGIRADLVAGFLQKPYTATELVNRIYEILGGGPKQTGGRVLFPKFG